MLTGDVFVQEELITPEQLQLALDKQLEMGGDDPIARVMVQMGLITDRDRVRCMGKVWGVPYVEISESTPTEEALALLSPQFAKRFKSLPLEISDDKLIVAMANPLDVFVIDELRMNTGREIEPMIAVEEDILTVLAENYKLDTNIGDAIEGVMKDFDGDLEIRSEDPADDDEMSEAELRELGEDAPVVRLANLIVSQAVNDRASDIHIEPRKDCVMVRLRIDGIMMEAMKLPRKVAAPLTSRFKIVANMDIAEKRAPQDNRISATINGKEYDFRVSTLPVVFGEKIVMRVLDKAGINIGLTKLGFLSHNLKMLEELAQKNFGIILVTGPTGSGKTTTLYSLINQTNDGLKNIVTIEDPVEYQISEINQCNVNVKAGMTFSAGLRAMLRQDPDVIMIGEMRDRETATIAMEAALTGHLVFSTLHTNDASSAPSRLMDMDVEPFLIASSLMGVLAQRLVRQICPNCKESYMANRESLLRYGFPLPEEVGAETKGELKLFKGAGCDHCKGSGYRGRTGVYELMVLSDEMRDKILNRCPSHELRNHAIENGMKSLQSDAVQKILMGVTSVDEVLRVIYG
ncbi:MAG: type II/IV secretion system protein [Armatimonadetes bacterium]|nr:type II/IV secretion system protein [Armatimonadota bacterium]